MGWFDVFEFNNITLLLLGAPLVAGLIYKIRQYYLQANTYEGIDDNGKSLLKYVSMFHRQKFFRSPSSQDGGRPPETAGQVQSVYSRARRGVEEEE